MSAAAQPRRVWVTRTEPQAATTAGRLRAMGLAPVVAPVLEALRLEGAVVDLAGIEALAFTSGHAVLAFADLNPERALPTFVVGDATAGTARAAGFTQVVSADGDVRALAEAIARARAGPVLNPGAREVAADLPTLLADRGVSARAVAVYETVPSDAAPALSEIDAILLHSARAARIVAACVGGDLEAGRIDAYALSEAVGAPLRAAGLRSVQVAAHPDEAALLALLARPAP